MTSDVDDINSLSFEPENNKEEINQCIKKIDKESNYLFLLVNSFFASSVISILIYLLSFLTLPYKNFIIFGIVFIFNAFFTYYYIKL